MTLDRVPSLQSLGGHLAALGSVGHPLGTSVDQGARLSQALLAGVPAPQALEEAGISARVSRFVEQARPRDLAALLDDLSPVLARFEGRSRELGSLSAYAIVLAFAALAAGAILVGGTIPALEELARAGRDAFAPVSVASALPLLAQAAFVALLLAFAAVLSIRTPLFPFRRSRLRQERALVLGAAAAAARQGCELPAALRACGRLTVDSTLAYDAEEAAISLERGAPSGGTVLFGTLGAALFSGAAEQGAGPETLEALADFEEAAASAD